MVDCWPRRQIYNRYERRYYTFNADGTFTFNVGADFEIFGKGYALETDFGGLRDQSPDGNNDVENFPITQEDVDNISGTWYITAPGGKKL